MNWKALNPVAWASKALSQMRHAVSGGMSWLQLPGTRFNYEKEVTKPLTNSAVAATVNWVRRTFPEAPCAVYKDTHDGEPEIVPNHEMSELIRHPNRFYSGTVLWSATIPDYIVSGNAYWVIVRNSLGKPVELWWTPSWLITPKGTAEEFITHYEYSPTGTPMRLETTDVIHLRNGIDPENPLKGMSELGAVIREIFTDDEAANFTAALLRNYAVPGYVVSPDTDTAIDESMARLAERKWNSRFGGDNRGKVLVNQGRTKIERISFSPAELDLGKLRAIPEERITAVLGIPAAVVGLGTGLEQTKVGATMSELREQAYESGIIPLQRMISEQLETSLLRDFSVDPFETVGFDLRNVRVLQDDQDKLFTRLNTGVQGGWIKVTDAQRLAGIEVDDTQNGYLRNTLTYSLVRSGEEPQGQLPPPQSDDETEQASADYPQLVKNGHR